VKAANVVKEPPQFGHLICKSKRYMMQEERYNKIDRENQNLLDRMTGILMQSP